MRRLTPIKIVVVCSNDGEGWKSCLSAEKDLQRLYKLAFPKQVHFIYLGNPRLFDSIESGSKYIYSIALKIYRLAPTHIVFLSHRIHSAPILQALDHLQFNRASFLFHIFGNWQIRLRRWRRTQEYFRGRRALFLTNSTAFQKMVSASMNSGQRRVKTAPLSIDSARFRFSASARAKVRRQMKISEKETVVLFAGRLIREKGLPLFIKSIQQLSDQKQHLFRVIVCGGFEENEADEMKRLLLQASRKMGSQFRFLGELRVAQLAKLYSAADVFVSPSLYDFESFGFGPAEALTSGLTCVLTDWLGYSDFSRIPGLVHWLPANERKCQEALTRTLAQLFRTRAFQSPRGRFRLYNNARIYSHSAQIERLQKLFHQPNWPVFHGFKS